MLLKSSLLALFIANILLDDLAYIFLVGIIILTINILKNKSLIKNLKKIKFLILFYMGSCFIQLFYLQEGQILYKIGSFYLTKIGVTTVAINFLRILNLLMISWLINAKSLLRGPFKRYQEIGECVVEMVPEVFQLFKGRMKLKWFFRHILKQIKVKI